MVLEGGFQGEVDKYPSQGKGGGGIFSDIYLKNKKIKKIGQKSQI